MYSFLFPILDKLVHNLWYRILDFPLEIKKTALQRLYEEVVEARGMCTNGFMVRMVNVLQGLDDKIIMKLETRQIMQTRVPLTMKKMRKAGNWIEGEEPWEWYRDCYKETCKDLDDCDEHMESARMEWLSPFLEGLFEELKKGYEPSQSDTETLLSIQKQEFIKRRFHELDLPKEDWAIAAVVAELNI